jgi:serine/threonine protein phosphatase 1
LPSRTFAIGDIHGCDCALDVLLSNMEITEDDTLVILGDVVDRGPGTKQVIDRLLELERSCRLIFLLGNHEECMIDALDGGPLRELWLEHGGVEAIESYRRESEIPARHIEFLHSGRDYWEDDNTIYVHANLEPGVPLAEQSSDWLRWIKLKGDEPPHPSGKRVICGHTPQKNDKPLVFPGWVCLDTCAYGGGFLTCLDVDANLLYQARQTGEYRGGAAI